MTHHSSLITHHFHSVRLPEFEGPLDLLLDLIERRQFDITTVSLLAVTEQYLAHLRASEPDPDALADFLAVAAKLLFIKSRSLLPRPPAVDEPEDPGAELVAQLTEYRRYREVAVGLRGQEASGGRAYPRTAPPPAPTWRLKPGAGDPAELLAAYVRAARRSVPAPVETVARRLFTIGEKLAELAALLVAGIDLPFGRVVQTCGSRHEVVVTFLALLELVRGGRAEARQEEPFDEIYVRGRAISH